MILNSPVLVLKAINATFAKSLLEQDTKDDIKKISEYLESENANEEFVFFDSMPAVKEFLDKVDYEKFKAFYLQIINKEWQFGFPIKRTTIEDTQANGLLPQIQKFIQEGARSWIDFPIQLISDLLTANGLAFDNTNFFANNRPNLQGTNVINNIVTGTGTTIDKIKDDLGNAINRLLGFKAKNGRAYNRNAKWLVLTPSQLYTKFLALQNNDTITVGGGVVNNEFKGTFEIFINYDQDITNNDWYLINSNAVVKPFVYVLRQEPIFDMVDNLDEPVVKYISKARMNVGYGNPMSIALINN